MYEVRELALDIDDPDGLPLNLETLKSDLRISDDDLDGVIVEQYIPDAVEWAEGAMRRSIVSREHRWVLSDFPRGYDQTIRLPRGKTQSVTSIAYSSGGSVVTLTGPTSSPTGTDYQEDLRGNAGGRLMPPRGDCWPSVDCDVPSPVVITFTAGWAIADVPADIRRALIASIYDAMELNGLLVTKSGFDIEFRDKLISGWRCF